MKNHLFWRAGGGCHPISGVRFAIDGVKTMLKSDAGRASGSPETTEEQDLREAVARLWEDSQDLFRARLGMIEQAVAAIESGRLRKDLQTKAYENAHKLAGSLGCFGFLRGTELARDLERIFEPHTVLGIEQARAASGLLSDLRLGLGKTSDQKSIFGELMARAAPGWR